MRHIETEEGRLLLKAEASTGYLNIIKDSTWTDLRDIIAWFRTYHPGFLTD